MVQNNLDGSDLTKLKCFYISILNEHTKVQETIQNYSMLHEKSFLKNLEEEEAKLGLRRDEIENKIIDLNNISFPDHLEYLSIVLDILARRESLTEHPLVIALNKCLNNAGRF